MSQIEQIITEIEDYMDSCKFQPLSQTKLIVNKDEMEELLTELRLKMPDEIKKYQKIIANKEAILSDAKEKSEAMIAEATAHITELVSEHEIMQRAQEEADQYVIQAREEAKKILEPILNVSYGLCIAQEQFMQLVQLPELGGLNLTWADKLRKSIAKKNPKEYDELTLEDQRLIINN